MGINVMREFDVSLKDKYWEQKYCVDVNNIAYSKNLNERCPLEINEGHTYENSDFICGVLFGILINVQLQNILATSKIYAVCTLHWRLNMLLK